MNREELISDLSPFCDIGTSNITASEKGGKITAKLIRDGRPLKLVVDQESGKVQCTWGSSSTRNFSSLAAALASEIFSNLRRWADSQRDLLKMEIPTPAKLLPIHGITQISAEIFSISEVEAILGGQRREQDSTEILLIDGPAGIGKTSLIEQLALLRAENYKTSSKPLILHVKSRGRVLSNLLDLMAFSLQTIRSQNTYDQIPILAKYGLVAIAIDGFDELADPNGYETAWAQLGELATAVRGKGTLILAGRDTFIGHSRLLKDVPAIRESVDIVNSITLKASSPSQAKEWLQKHGWTEKNFELPSIAVLLEPESFALRPVFLRLLAEHVKPKDLKDKHERYLTPLLVNYMIEREAGLFGKPVQSVMDEVQRRKFLSSFLGEVARQMADAQTEALDSNEIAWIGEASLVESIAPELVNIIKNRAHVVAFFINDERPGFKRFMHSYLLNYFVAIECIKALANGEIPKFIRRNLLGSEFLSIFSDVAAEFSISEKEVFSSFWERIANSSMSYTSSDRGLRNIGALVLASLPSIQAESKITLREFQIDESIIRGSCPHADLANIQINQLDIRESDISLLKWTNCMIGNLIADNSVRVSKSIPQPIKITLIDGKEITSAQDISIWLDNRGRKEDSINQAGIASASLRKKPIYGLLMKAARLRQYWLRMDDEDFQASKIIGDENWPTLSQILLSHGYLKEEVRQASGRASKFFHIKNRENILAESPEDESLRSLFEELAGA
ncbi:hypothetical protein [Pseudacidovorax intermedius]|uniref:hypothetical protein n=1 Tax=Pseudacidovorax intermedius TaxID=433924 RepID=UPI0026EFB0F4|nr:hypothetical protein [Pseudacidovorax intermedius]